MPFLQHIPPENHAQFTASRHEENPVRLQTCLYIAFAITLSFWLQITLFPTPADLMADYANLLFLASTVITFLFILVLKFTHNLYAQSIINLGYVLYYILWASIVTIYDCPYDPDYSAYTFGLLGVLFFYRTSYRNYILLMTFAFTISVVFFFLMFPHWHDISFLVPLFIFSIAITILVVKCEELRIINSILQFEIDAKNQELLKLAIRDELTQLYNRRHFNQIFQGEIRRAQRTRHPVSLLMIDVDFFKHYNDTYGHQKGDRVLIQLAEVLMEAGQRINDYAFRLGGEEFAMIFTHLSNTEAENFANTIRKKVEQLHIKHESNPQNPIITISLGLITRVPERQTDVTWFYKQADCALYQAKNSGRNKIVVL